jgi:competence protein ComEA
MHTSTGQARTGQALARQALARQALARQPRPAPGGWLQLRHNAASLGLALALGLLGPGALAQGQPGPAAQKVATADAPSVNAGVDINRAAASEIASGLTGIGLRKAEALVRYREQFGPFESVEELTEVKGIGPATLERNRGLIRLQ